MKLKDTECIVIYAIGSYTRDKIGIQPLDRRVSNRFNQNDFPNSLIYPTLKRLIDKMLIDNTNHYSLTEKGKELYDKNKDYWYKSFWE